MRGHGKTQRKKPVRNVICAAALTLGANWPTAQGAEFETLEAESAVSPAGVRVVPNWQSEPPVSTDQHDQGRELLTVPSLLPGSLPDPSQGAVVVSMVPRSSQSRRSTAGTTTRLTNFNSAIPASVIVNDMASSVGVNNRFVFYTGDRFAARSTDGGRTFTFTDPTVAFPDYWHDHLALYDQDRGLLFWLQEGVGRSGPEPGTLVSSFSLSVSNDNGLSFCSYSFLPSDLRTTWTSGTWAIPQMRLGNRFLYITWNLIRGDLRNTRGVMLRFPLAAHTSTGWPRM